MRCLLPAPSSGFPFPSFLPGRGVWLEKDASCIFVVSAGKSRVKPPKHVARPTQATLPTDRQRHMSVCLPVSVSANLPRRSVGLPPNPRCSPGFLYRDILTVPRLGVAPVAVQRISTKNRTTEAAIPGEVFGRGRDSLELRHDVGQQRVGHCNHGLPRPARRARRAIQHRPLREAVGAGAARGAEGR